MCNKNTRRFCSEEKENVTVVINFIKLIVWKYLMHIMRVNEYSRIFNAVSACSRRLAQFVVKTEQIVFPTEGNNFGSVDVELKKSETDLSQPRFISD
jgi:hypothetical protein